jgi:CHAT domain-containing protein
MHSLTDDKDPSLSRLLFTLTPKDTTNDNDLTAAELYTTSLKADLAVLSACNTGFGTLNKGEGVMSLARAFTYAGVPSTVTSLWKVPDLTTREIMVDFYKNLKSGKTKDAALREAKLTYLNNAPESIAANPYFWAGFVPMGNMEAMNFEEKRPLSIWGILAGIVGVLGIGFWAYKNKFSSTDLRI